MKDYKNFYRWGLQKGKQLRKRRRKNMYSYRVRIPETYMRGWEKRYMRK